MSGANAPTQHNVTVSAVRDDAAERLRAIQKLTGHDWGKRLPEAPGSGGGGN